ncbi:MAG: sugar ABC transporter permease [Treponema sp.]|nr:sugar ABC transporter permease [Treponema sp.]
MRQKIFPSMVLGRKFNTGWFFILPAVVSFLMFKYYPMLMGMLVSFFRFDVMNPPGDFVGFRNYARAFKDPLVRNALKNTSQFWVIMLLMNQFVPLILAVMVDEVRKNKALIRTLYYLPAILPGIVTTVLWKYFWQPDYGLANFIVTSIGFKPQMWLNDINLVKICMRFPGLLIMASTGGGMYFIIYLAALNGINKEMYESAQVDGATFFRRLFSITIPSILPTIGMLIIMSTMGTFNMFDEVMIMTGGGPARSTETLVLYAFQKAYRETDYSYAVTITVLAFIIVFLLTLLQMRVQRGRDE